MHSRILSFWTNIIMGTSTFDWCKWIAKIRNAENVKKNYTILYDYLFMIKGMKNVRNQYIIYMHTSTTWPKWIRLLNISQRGEKTCILTL